MPTITIIWHSMSDQRTCPVCKALNGFKWIFVAGEDIMTDSLYHPQFGIVWSLSEGSNAHNPGFIRGGKHNCRCFITSYIDLEDVLAKCVFLKETITDVSEDTEIPDMKKGSYRTTTLEDLGITL